MNFITTKKKNKTILSKHLLKYPKDERKDILYELSFMKLEKKSLPDIFTCLKESKIGFFHDDFLDISKKIKETDMFMNKPFDITEGVNECSKCHSKRTISYGKQNRSGDEGMTVYVTCIDCKYRYTMNS
jgi:DNA-directed RNA polymerase subunit M/transcription elongation factor TFIIS